MNATTQTITGQEVTANIAIDLISAEIQKAREESGLGRGYTVMLKVSNVLYPSKELFLPGAHLANAAIEDGKYTILIAPCSAKTKIKFEKLHTLPWAVCRAADPLAPGAFEGDETTIEMAQRFAKENEDKAKKEEQDLVTAKAKAVELGIGEVPFGAFVWWNMRSVNVTPTTAREIIGSRVEDRYSKMIKDINENQTVYTEGKKWKLFLDGEKYTCGVADEDDTTVTFGIKHNVVSDASGKKRNDDLQVETVVWDKASRSFIAGGNTEVSGKFVADMEDRCYYLQTKHVRPALQRMVTDMGAICLKDQGGFLPGSYRCK